MGSSWEGLLGPEGSSPSDTMSLVAQFWEGSDGVTGRNVPENIQPKMWWELIKGKGCGYSLSQTQNSTKSHN